MAKTMYDVPLLSQANNPVCWMACIAMVLSWKNGQSLGIGLVSGGYDPSSTSIPNLSSWPAIESDFRKNGFTLERNARPDAAYVERLLSRSPFILTHLALNFPYHFGRPVALRASDTHAIVVTGIDVAGFEGQGRCWFNNPWGTKNSSCHTGEIVAAMKKLPAPWNPVAYLP